MVSIDSIKSILWQGGFMLIISFIVVFLSCVQKSQMIRSAQNLKCEYQTNPLGIDVLKPRFSWVIKDSRRGAVQSAYQILVASSEKLLQKDEGDIWDSGKVDSDQSVHVVYDGKPLESRKRYFWKVRTWDAEEKSSAYSQAAWWEMGLLNPDDWRAQWIGKEIKKTEPEPEAWPWGYWIWHPTEIGIDKPVYFRKTFNLPTNKKIKNALVRTTADNYFTVFINENEVGSGSNWTEVYEFAVEPLLQAGKNIITIRAANNSGEVCGLLFSIKVEFDDGTSIVINSDPSWKTTSKEATDWKRLNFQDKDWSNIRVIEEYGGGQWGKLDPHEIYQPPRSTLVRKEFTPNKAIKQARAYVTGLGSYIMYLNGVRVGNDIFSPEWTDYPTRIQYQTYDVTSLVKSGENAVGAVLGNVWWSGGLGWKGSHVYSEGSLRFMMQLIIDYEDGSTATLVTDQGWKTHDSPILENSIYHGETYDARLELPGWDQAGFDDADWGSVIVLEKEKAKLVAQQGPTIQITEEIKPIKITEPDSGVYVFDMGQNMVGWVRLKATGSAGTKVVMRFAEVLQEDGNIYTANLRGARATDTYILKGEGAEVWEPHFTYHGFRYIEITGYPGKPNLDAITGRVFHSNSPVIGHFACSNELLNKIQKNINWGLRGNMHSVPTDCPQRDERLGWMGDAQIFAPTASYNRNMARFFSKWMHDIVDCQDEDGAVHDVNPAIVVAGPAKPGWGDAVVVVPWVVYQFYSDKRIIEQNYDGMAAWVDYMKNHSVGYLYERDGYGDWIAVVESPKKPIGAAYFYYCTKLMAKMAAIVGKNADAAQYEQLAEKIADAFNQKYLDQSTLQYESATQTANLLPLAFGITPDDLKSAVVANVVKDVIQRENHLSTGFLGTAYILPILSQFGYHYLAYQLASQNTYPSWGYMVEKDATTIWELWNSDTAGPGMNSRNHFALGSVGEWYFGYLAGLRPDPDAPGFKRAIIAPKPAGDLIWAEAHYESVYGPIQTRWDKKDETLTLKISIPANTSAMLYIPTLGKDKPNISEGGKIIFENEKAVAELAGIKFLQLEKEAVVFEIGSGSYEFEIR